MGVNSPVETAPFFMHYGKLSELLALPTGGAEVSSRYEKAFVLSFSRIHLLDHDVTSTRPGNDSSAESATCQPNNWLRFSDRHTGGINPST